MTCQTPRRTWIIMISTICFIIVGTENIPTKADISSLLMKEINPKNIDENIKYLSSKPHLAGTPEDLEVATWVRDRFLQNGLDEAHLVPYKILLSYPDKDKPNQVFLLDSLGQVNYTTSGKQTPLSAAAEFSPLVPHNFNAYSPSGTVQGGLVYANYGRKEDFDYLASKKIEVRGNIVIARYGAIFRGNIVDFASQAGAVGVILYSDPKDFAPEGRKSVYPNSTRMPGMAAQSGSVLLGYGDPLTPLYPALESAYRIPEDEAELPDIPAQPIGYDEAEVLLRAISGDNPAPPDWQGGLGIQYNIGPKFANGNWSVRLIVRTANKMGTIYNTIGILRGREEPDRYVLMGNHMDAWVLGAVDPASGTGAMIEIARAFGSFKEKLNWRPRRTLMFCGWGAEEYGMIGSYEWAEEHAKVLSQRAVAYINVDSAMEGNFTFSGYSVPSLHKLIYEAAKKVPNPDPAEVAAGRLTVFDTWLYARPDPLNSSIPKIGNLGSGSAHTAPT